MEVSKSARHCGICNGGGADLACCKLLSGAPVCVSHGAPAAVHEWGREYTNERGNPSCIRGSFVDGNHSGAASLRKTPGLKPQGQTHEALRAGKALHLVLRLQRASTPALRNHAR